MHDFRPERLDPITAEQRGEQVGNCALDPNPVTFEIKKDFPSIPPAPDDA
jgi:hypothetical protein